MKKKTVAILVISLVAVAGITTGILLWGQGTNEEELNIAYYAFASEPILDWDPAVCYSDGLIVLNNVYETLLKYDPYTEDFEKVLATDYAISEDEMSWTFTLRENVTFHDGTPFNATAVQYSIYRTLEINKGAAFIWYAIDNVTILSEFEVQFNLFYPAPMDLTVACPYAAFIMSPNVLENSSSSEWFESGNEAGTGPYKLNSTVLGDEVILDKFDNYWGGWKENQFDKVIIKKHAESSVRRTLVEGGEADITGLLPAVDIDALKNVSTVNVSDNLSFTNTIAHFNTEVAPLNDSRVRQALAFAFPYQDVVDTAAGGYANQSTGVVPAGLWGHDDDLFQYYYNETKSLELLEEAGVDPNDIELELTYTSGDEAHKIMAELYQANLAKINVTLSITGLPWTSQWERAKNDDPELRQDIYIMYWWPDISSPFSWLYTSFTTNYEDYILFNLAYYSNYDVDDLVFWANEVSGTNRTLAEELYIDAQAIILEDCPAIFAYDQRDVFVMSNSFQGFEYNPSYPNTVFFYECYQADV